MSTPDQLHNLLMAAEAGDTFTAEEVMTLLDYIDELEERCCCGVCGV